MKKSSPTQWVIRIFFYVLGLFFMAMGVAFSVNSNLGDSPVNSLPYVYSPRSSAISPTSPSGSWGTSPCPPTPGSS